MQSSANQSQGQHQPRPQVRQAKSGKSHDVHQDQKGRAKNGNLGCLTGQLAGGGAHFFLFVDKARGLIV